jgi:DNA-binding CsgD family transcriptional regulator
VASSIGARNVASLVPPTQLFGRDRELQRIDGLLAEGARSGGSLLILGEPGIGKSALLEEAKKRAEPLGLSTLAATGAPFEAQMPFAGLQGLLRPLASNVDALPKRQREALSVAFGVGEGPAPDVYLIALATLQVLVDRAAEGPLLIVVEDAHWLDAETCELLAFVARRLAGEPIVVLFAARDEAGGQVGAAGLAELRLEPLDQESATALLLVSAPELAADVRRRVLSEASGNPLALIELPRALSSAANIDLAATTPLPLTERLERAFAGRVSELPASTRVVLLVAALDESAGLRELLAAASLLDKRESSVDDLAPAAAAGLISFGGQTLRFRHPLVRAAIHLAAPESERRKAHAALAETFVADPDRSVWHRAAALTGTDPEAAAELEAAAERALRRGAPAVAAAALERAVRLSDADANRGRLLVRVAEIEIELGRADIALKHLAEAKPLALQPRDRTRLTLWLEALDEDSWTGPARVAAFAAIADQLTSTEDTALALRPLLTVAIGCWWGNPSQETRDLVVGAAQRLQIPADDPVLIAILACADPVNNASLVIDRISRMTPDAGADPAALHLIGTAATAVWAFDLSWGFLSAATEGLREQGRLGLLAQALVSQAWAAIHLAKASVAVSAADEAARLARETGQLRWALAADLAAATAAGERGDFATGAALVNQAEAELLPIGAQAMLSMVQFARGRYSVAHTRHAEGYEHLRRVLDPDDVAYHPFVGYWALADLIEAAVRSGRHDEARLRLHELEALVEKTSASYLRATLAYVKAVVAEDDEAEQLYQAALGTDIANWPCYRARLLLNYGRWLRRQRRVAESRAPLRAALESIDALGFDGLAEIARSELRASGEAVARRAPEARDQLSPQELQIAQLAAEGLTNREIGEKLFLSHRTISTHLHRIFPKLGITSRSELARILPAEPAPDFVGAQES